MSRTGRSGASGINQSGVRKDRGRKARSSNKAHVVSRSRQSTLLSAVIITYNEEANLADCIASVHDWVDEVLILDSHSTDTTRKIARSFSRVRFMQHDFDGHIAQKNRAIEMSGGNWIFSLDADERVTTELSRSILDFIKTNPTSPGVRVRRLTYHLGRAMRYGGWYNTRYRLLRKGCGEWGGENPHDTIYIFGQTVWKRLRSPVLKGDLIHYSFTDLSDQVDTINKFSSIVAFTRHGRKKHFSFLKLLFKPLSKFIETYFVKMGFMDGIPGLIAAVLASNSAFLKVAKLYELERTETERPSNLRADYRI